MAGNPHIPSKGLINGPVYDVAHFSTAYLNVPPNLHRLRNAIGLTAGIYLGRKTMDILAGETINGKKVRKDDLPAPLRPLHGILAYDHFSDDPKDRWMKVFDMMVPGILGGIGAGVGSLSFFEKDFMKPIEAKMNSPAKNFFLTDAERQALYIQSKPASVPAGSAAVFGSASGFGLLPSWLNYSSTLGALFTVRAERAMANPVLRRLFNAHSPYPFRPRKLIHQMIEYAAGNPAANPEQLESYARGIIKTWFKNADPEHIKAFADFVKTERNQFLKDGRLPEEAAAKVKEMLWKGMSETGLEKTLIKIGLDPREANIGDMGFLSSLTHLLGNAFGMKTTQGMEETRKLLQQGLEIRHPELIGKAFRKPSTQYADDIMKKVTVGGLALTGAGTLAAISAARDSGVADLDPSGNGHGNNNLFTHDGPEVTLPENGNEPGIDKKESKKQPASFTERVPSANKHILHSKKHHGAVNGKILDTAEGITGMLNAGVGMHRVHCAIGLTVGSWLGDKVMEALTGYSFGGNALKEHDIIKPLRKIYKALPFNPHSDLPQDKWMQVIRWGIPGIMGTLAVMQGSRMFFEQRREKLYSARYLDEVEDKATMAQSRPWSYTSAISGLFGFPSGLPMLPLVNYSTNLGTRFSMASGRKVSLPVVGKIWSNNSTLFPFGPPGMLDRIIQEAINNKAHDPELLETYAIGVLKPWFDNVTPHQVEAFVSKIHDVRDKFFQEGGVPEDMKKQLQAELKAHFRGAGLEETLEQIGLDPLKATIASNGLSGTIANVLGAEKEVSKIQAKYAEGYRERVLKRQQETTQDHGPTV